MFAVAPDQVALHELEHFMGVDPGWVSMLSIGTATAHCRPAGGVRDACRCGRLAVATPQAVDTLSALARKTLRDVDPQRLAAFL